MKTWPLVATVAGAGIGGLVAWAAKHPAAQLFGPTIRHTGRPSALALTFDDGPNPDVTPGVLDLLERYQIQATFFLIGKHVRACPQLTADMPARGHVLGNHTDTHPNLFWFGSRCIREELLRCQESIERATGREPAWMRPPFGARGPNLDAVVRRTGFRGIVMWSVAAHDWIPQPAAHIIRRLRRTRGGDIVVLHDGDHRQLRGDRRHVLRALEFCLPQWKDAGLEFVTLDQIAGTPLNLHSEGIASRG